MLSLWSEDILEVWTEVYAVASGCLIKVQSKLQVQQECRNTMNMMSEGNQPIKVRIKAARLLGQMAQFDSVGDGQIYL